MMKLLYVNITFPIYLNILKLEIRFLVSSIGTLGYLDHPLIEKKKQKLLKQSFLSAIKI